MSDEPGKIEKYQELLHAIKIQVSQAQSRAFYSANAIMTGLYWLQEFFIFLTVGEAITFDRCTYEILHDCYFYR